VFSDAGCCRQIGGSRGIQVEGIPRRVGPASFRGLGKSASPQFRKPRHSSTLKQFQPHPFPLGSVIAFDAPLILVDVTRSSTRVTFASTHSIHTPHSFAMRTVLLLFPALHASITLAQVATTLPNTLPACAQQCTILTSAQQSCASNAAAYQSCFCQSALLSQLYTSQPIQLCTQCSAADMASIQTWYKASCQNGGTVAAANQPTTTSTPTPSPSTATTTPRTSHTGGTTTTNQQDSNSGPSGPWYVLLSLPMIP
jgi:hypothetical protein